MRAPRSRTLALVFQGIHSVNQVEEAREVWSSNASYLSLDSAAYRLFSSLILSMKVLQGLLLDTFSTTSGFVVLFHRITRSIRILLSHFVLLVTYYCNRMDFAKLYNTVFLSTGGSLNTATPLNTIHFGSIHSLQT